MRYYYLYAGLAAVMVTAWADPLYQLPAIGATAPLPIANNMSMALGNQVIISAADINRAGVNSLADLLNHVSGVRYDSGVAHNPQIFIRNKPALILLNGVPLTNFSMAAPNISLLTLNQIQKVVITPGSAGVEYGDQAIGGVINIITTVPPIAQTTLTFTGGYPWSEDIGVQSGVPLANQWTVAGGADYQNSLGYRDFNTSTQTNLNGTVQKNYATGQVSWQWLGLNQNVELPGALTAAQLAQSRTQSIASAQGTFANNSLDNIVRWNQQLPEQWQSTTTLHQNQQWGVASYAPTWTPSSQLSNTWYLDQQFERDLEWWKLPLNWTGGLSLEQDGYSYAGLISQSQRFEYGLYTTGDWQLPDQFDLSLGAREILINTNGQFYAENQEQQFVLQPSAEQFQKLFLTTQELSKQLTAALQVYVRRAQSYQLPFIDQSNYTQGTIILLPGFGLQPQTATSYETGLNWQSDHWQWSSELYWMDIKNEIAYAPISASEGANINLPPIHNIGALLSATDQITRQWQLGSQITAARQWFVSGPDTGDQVPDAPEWLVDLNSRYHFSDNWSIEGDAQYNGSQFADGDFSNSLGAVPGYWLLNTALTYQNKNWVSSFRIDNIINIGYNLYTVAVPNDPGSGNQIDYYPAPGRVFLWNLQYILGT